VSAKRPGTTKRREPRRLRVCVSKVHTIYHNHVVARLQWCVCQTHWVGEHGWRWYIPWIFGTHIDKLRGAVHAHRVCALSETLPGPWYVVCVTVRTPNSGRRTSCAVWRRRQCTFWQTVTAFFWPSHPSCARCRCATNLMSRDMGNRPRRMRTSQPARR